MNESGVVYAATDATPTSTPEPGMVRQILAYNPHLMMVRHNFKKGWVRARHKHPHHQMVYFVSGRIPFKAKCATHKPSSASPTPRRWWSR
jgi:quercetin dioxygenase-like cupin family protein